MTSVAYDYRPTPKPSRAPATNFDVLMYGGAAGGGKSRAGRAEAVRMATMVPGSLTYVFRRTFPQLQQDVIPKLREEMPPGIASYNKSEHTWYFSNSSRIVLGHMQNDDDVDNFLSSEPQLCVFEELTQFLEPQYRKMRARLRAAGPVLHRMNALGWVCRSFATTNPGGIGHGWVKARFVDPGIHNTPWHPKPTDDELDPGPRCFIPARLEDNPHMDSGYARKLDNLEPTLRRAYRDGDWDILKGVRFSQWRQSVHTIRPEELPLPLVDYPRAVGVDFGSEAPFVALWGALLPDDLIFIYRELYLPNLTAREQAQMILSSEDEGERISTRALPVVCDPSMWIRSPDHRPSKDQDPRGDWAPMGSIARTYQDELGRATVRKANNARVAGWALLDEHLRVRSDGLPRLLVSTACPNLIRTLPAVPRSKLNPEDVNTKSEDHAVDAARYLCMYLAGGGIRRVQDVTPRIERRPVTAGMRTAQF